MNHFVGCFYCLFATDGYRWIQMHTDAVASIVVTYTCRDRIGLVQALACHPLPRMCSLSQGLLFKWRTELTNEETPIERSPLLRSPAQHFSRYSTPLLSPRAMTGRPLSVSLRIHGPRQRDCCFMPFKATGCDWLDLRGKRVCLSRDRQSSSSGFGAYQQEVLNIWR